MVQLKPGAASVQQAAILLYSLPTNAYPLPRVEKLLLATGIATVRSTGEVLARVGEAQATSAGVNCRAGHAVAGSDIVTSGSVILATGPTAASFTAGAINLTAGNGGARGGDLSIAAALSTMQDVEGGNGSHGLWCG